MKLKDLIAEANGNLEMDIAVLGRNGRLEWPYTCWTETQYCETEEEENMEADKLPIREPILVIVPN